MADPHADRWIAELASRQHGAVARRQLVALGLSRRAVEHRLATGRLHRIHQGVYLVGHTARASLARESAALLAAGDHAALSHLSAAAIVGILREAPGPVHVVVWGRDGGSYDGLRLYRRNPLASQDLIRHDVLTLTAPWLTLLDLAGALSPRELRWAYEEARVRRLVTPEQVRDVLARHPRRRGAAQLRALAGRDRGPRLTRSEAERRLLELIHQARLPEPILNHRVAGFEVDAHWPSARLVAEVDGFAFHRTRAAFERDRQRDAALQSDAWRVVRLSWRQIVDEPLAVAALLGRMLASA